MTPTPAEGTGKPEFQRWYRRELVRAHLYFAVSVVAMIGVVGCVEALDWRRPLAAVSAAILVAAGVALCVVSIRRYSLILRRAERLVSEHEAAKP